MAIFFAFTSALALLLGSSSRLFTFEIAAPFHQACLDSAPPSPFRLNYELLVCAGKEAFPPSNSDWLKESKKLGLSHFFLMSGAQIFFIEWIAQSLALGPGRRSGSRSPLRLLLQLLLWSNLFGLLLMSNCSGKILRALLVLVLSRCTHHFNFRWSRIQILTGAGLLTLVLTPPSSALSVLMSWIASLTVFSLSPQTRGQAQLSGAGSWLRRLFFHLAGYILLFPALLSLSPQHPLNLAYSFFVGTLLSPVLFPAALLAYGFPGAHHATDRIWLFVHGLMSFFLRFSPAPLTQCEISTSVLAAYLSLLTVAAWWLERKQEL